MKTHVQNPRGRATDRTPVVRDNTAEGGQIKYGHGHGQGAFYKEAKKTGRKQLEAGEGGQMWVGEWVKLGKGGRGMGKRTGLAHIKRASTRLGPGKSTQVVDFPHLSVVRLFWEAMKSVATDGTRIKLGLGRDIEQKVVAGTEMDRWKSVKFFMLFHDFSRFITEIKPVIPRFSRFFGWDQF
jgi:hypothetical protein